MAYLFGDSFDFYGTLADMSTRWDVNGATALVASASTPFGTGQALLLNGHFGCTCRKIFGSNAATIYFSMRVKLSQAVATDTDYIAFVFLDGTTAQMSMRFHFDGSITFHTGTGTQIGSLTAATSASWTSWQGKIVLSTTVGSVELRRSGNTSNDFTLTGVNTQGGTGNAYVNGLQINNNTDFTNSGITIDDLFLCSGSGAVPNTWPGDLRAVQQVPTAATQSQFTATGAASNWQAVANLTNDGDTSYVASSTVGQEDIYSLSAIPTTYGVVGVSYLANLKKMDAGTRSAAIMVQANGSADTPELTNTALSTSYGYSTVFMPIDPTGAAWTPTTVNGAKLGIKIAA